MNLSILQLAYVVAIDDHGSFSKAADFCNVTQPSLSQQIKKMEEELGTELFVRTTKSLSATKIGNDVIRQARRILAEIDLIEDIVKEGTNNISGSLKVGMLPTIAPYLVPLFVGDFLRKYPGVELHIVEEKTEDILRQLRNKQLDAAILATPLGSSDLLERPIYYEKFICYQDYLSSKKSSNRVSVEQLLNDKIWVLSEGNCFRDQTFNLCEINQPEYRNFSFQYESGSLEALIKLVDKEGGSTIIPELATLDFAEERMDQLKFIGEHNPVRQISLVTRQRPAKKKVLDMLFAQVARSLPPQIKENTSDYLIEVEVKY